MRNYKTDFFPSTKPVSQSVSVSAPPPQQRSSRSASLCSYSVGSQLNIQYHIGCCSGDDDYIFTNSDGQPTNQLFVSQFSRVGTYVQSSYSVSVGRRLLKILCKYSKACSFRSLAALYILKTGGQRAQSQCELTNSASTCPVSAVDIKPACHTPSARVSVN